jgi:hypothetical protein
MKPSSSIWRWILPVVLLVVVLSNVFAWRSQPASTLVRQMWASTNATLSAANPAATQAWRLLVLLDTRAIPPGPEWILHEGRQPGEGYELHWFPQRLALQVFRTGEQTMLLGSVTLKKAPGEVQFARRGLRLSVRADRETVMQCIDLTPPPAPQVWGFQAVSSVGHVLVSLFDDKRYLSEVDAALAGNEVPALRDACTAIVGEDHALARMRYAAVLDPSSGGVTLTEAMNEAEIAISALGENHPDSPSMRAWLAWARMRVALASLERDAVAHVHDAFMDMKNQLADSGDQRAPELPGLLLQALPALTTKACARPTGPTSSADVLQQRQQWLALLSQAGRCAMQSMPEAVTDNVTWQLRLLVHGADCLNRQPPLPTPAEGPDWATCRWRAFAGRDPRVSELPPIPSGWCERNPVYPALDKVISFANFEPLAAVSMQARIYDAIEHDSAEEIIRALRGAPAREGALARALLALHGKGDAIEAKKELLATNGQQAAWANQDPLAYALIALMDHRQKFSKVGEAAPATKDPIMLASGSSGQALAAYERLLSGNANAINEIWTHDAAVLPPAQALASALAMQEAVGGESNWQLLKQVPCYTLPLSLMIPAHQAAAAQPQSDTPVLPAAPADVLLIP